MFADIQPDTQNIDPQRVREAITERTRAIIPVHIFGQAAEMDEIRAIASENNLKIIEDCAQSFGSHYHQAMTGSIGDLGAFSFFPSKNLGCYGDGGLVTTQSDEYAQQLKTYRNHGSSQPYHHDVIGYNSRLDELQAVILRIKLKHIDDYNSNRKRVAATYNRLLADSNIQTPIMPQEHDHVFHQYTVLADNRDAIKEHLLSKQIACAVYYPIPLHQQKAFADAPAVSLPVTEDISQRCVSFPIFPEMTDQQIQTVCDAVLEVA